MVKFIKRLICNHDYYVEGKITPFIDENNNGYVIYTCAKCGKKFGKNLYNSTFKDRM